MRALVFLFACLSLFASAWGNNLILGRRLFGDVLAESQPIYKPPVPHVSHTATINVTAPPNYVISFVSVINRNPWVVNIRPIKGYIGQDSMVLLAIGRPGWALAMEVTVFAIPSKHPPTTTPRWTTSSQPTTTSTESTTTSTQSTTTSTESTTTSTQSTTTSTESTTTSTQSTTTSTEPTTTSTQPTTTSTEPTTTSTQPTTTSTEPTTTSTQPTTTFTETTTTTSTQPTTTSTETTTTSTLLARSVLAHHRLRVNNQHLESTI